MTQYRTQPESCFAYGTRGQNPIGRMNHRVIWSFGTLAKFIRHRTTAIRQLTFESRDRRYYGCRHFEASAARLTSFPRKNTLLILRVLEMESSGLASSTMKSALLPIAMLPMRSSPSTAAELRVPARIASIGVSPPLVTRSSSSMCDPSPKYWPPLTPPVSVPSTNRAPAAFSLRILRRLVSPASRAAGLSLLVKDSPRSRISSVENVSRRIGSSIQAGLSV